MDKIIQQSAILDCSPEEAFLQFTNNSQLESWLTAKAEVEPKVGGKYELFWEPETPENNSTLGCKVLAVQAPYYINFEWRGPVQFKDFMNGIRPLTNVTVIFSAMEAQTRVTLLHTGWQEGADWESARIYFVRAWHGAFAQLEKKINSQKA